MPDVEGILVIAREASNVEWGSLPDTYLTGDEDTFVVMPVHHPDEDQPYALIFVLDDPEKGELMKSLQAVPMHDFVHAYVEGGPGDIPPW